MHWSDRMGGSQYQAKLLIERLIARYDVQITYLTMRMEEGFVPEGYRLVRFSRPGGIRRYALFFDARRLYKALVEIQPDVIFQQVGCAYTGVAAFYAHRHDCRFFFRVSSDANVEPFSERWWRVNRRIDRRFLEYGMRRAEVVFAQTAYQQEQVRARFNQEALLIRNFHPQPVEPINKAAPITILWIANLKPLKNPLAFVRLAKRFAKRSEVRFLVAGGLMGPKNWNDTIVNQMGQAENLEYLGPQTQEQVNRLFARGHILVNTSDYEGFSNTFVQAWQRAVPVVSLAVNPDGLLRDSHLGLACDSDEEVLFKNVSRLVDDEGLRKKMGDSGKAHADAHHSESNADEMARIMGLDRRYEKA